jgi:hypothetical protein
MDAASTSIFLVQPPTLLGIESFIRSRSYITAKAIFFSIRVRILSSLLYSSSGGIT